MAEYVHRKALIDAIKRDCLEKVYYSKEDAINCIESMIATDVVPVVHGKWEYDPSGCDWGIGAWRCSECGCKNDALPWDNKLNPYAFACSRYCPHCGARMDGDG